MNWKLSPKCFVGGPWRPGRTMAAVLVPTATISSLHPSTVPQLSTGHSAYVQRQRPVKRIPTRTPSQMTGAKPAGLSALSVQHRGQQAPSEQTTTFQDWASA